MLATSLDLDLVREDNQRLPALALMTCHLGFLPLAQLPIIRLLGGSQFRKFCVICIVILVVTVWMTCFFHKEQARPETYKKQR
jgi:hypothetical protein